MNAAGVAKIFGCTEQQAKAQYCKNAKQLRQIEAKARTVNSKYHGLTADQWAMRAARFEGLSR